MDSFLSKENVIAVVGASNNKNKWGYKIYKTLKSTGYKVYPINPKHERIDNDKCYSNLAELPDRPDVVITVVPPSVTLQIVHQCKQLGIKKIWMQPGSESKEAITFCEKNQMKVVYNACFVADGLHLAFD